MWDFVGNKVNAGLPNLLCFPFAGGSPLTFRLWPPALEMNIFVANRPESETSNCTLTDIAASQLNSLQAANFSFENQYFTFGHSLGALNSYEFAVEIQRRGLPPPACSFFSGMSAPHVADGEIFTPPEEDSDEGFLSLLKKFRGTPESVLNDPDMMSYLLPGIKSDFKLLWGYKLRHRIRLQNPICVYFSESDSLIPCDSMGEWEFYSDDCAFRKFFGDHFYLQSNAADFLIDLRHQITSGIANAQGEALPEN
ncbi:thioesterase [Exilibacterium tricleocarpae]|uniref:Thioesterase n=1 Tax=Exilibacterium tricleocarpae TaxID=2591008 RepID=A0A545SS62_9GAMM|nr:thioesterase domain-containing protein [Exilibacterium tricleocarpae]TQV67808.1 thioesterase [Exilibacterium tricleocarpae]